MIVIKNDNINLNDTLECGQCFRFEKEKDNSYTIIIKDRAVNISQVDDKLYVNSNNEDNLKEIITNYLDLNTNYNELNNILIKQDIVMEKYINNSKGLKILKQDPFEMFISYIISANNNIKRISKAINSISNTYGEKVIFQNKEYYLFPVLDKLKSITKEDLAIHKLGYRDTYIIDAISKLSDNTINLSILGEQDTEDALHLLQKVKGIGPKVASCILLFGYHKFDVYPIDTWVLKTIKKDFDQINADQKSITKFAKKRFGKYSGLAIQYMYNASRNKGDKYE